jgi:hypothetical protein
MWRHGTGKIWRYSIGCGLHNTRILSYRRGRIAVGDVANKYNVRAKAGAKTSRFRSVTKYIITDALYYLYINAISSPRNYNARILINII